MFVLRHVFFTTPHLTCSPQLLKNTPYLTLLTFADLTVCSNHPKSSGVGVLILIIAGLILTVVIMALTRGGDRTVTNTQGGQGGQGSPPSPGGQGGEGGGHGGHGQGHGPTQIK